MEMERKEVSAELKSLNDQGEGVLRFIRFHQEDKDADITLPGFVGRQPAVLLAAHNWKSDYPPLGHGESFEEDGATNFRFRLNLDDPRAKSWYSWLKMDEQTHLQQVSYGFSPYADAVERTRKDGRDIRYLKPRPDNSPGAKLHEVSFVVVGSGNDTAVVNIKESAGMNAPEVPVVDHAPDSLQERPGDATLPSVEDYQAYAEDRRPPLPTLITWLRLYRYHMPFLRDIRQRDGKEISAETIGEFKTLVEEMLEVCTQFKIKLMTSALLPNVEEEAAQRQRFDGRLQELTQSVHAEEEEKLRRLQVEAEELARKAQTRSARMREMFGI